jgi:transposase
MRDIDLYAQILGIRSPWAVTAVDVDRKAGAVTVRVGWDLGVPFACPTCQRSCDGYDHRERTWRHLDTCQFKTFLVAKVPRVNCSEHGVLQAAVPWADPKSGFTALFEALVIDWLKEASISAVAELLRITWDEADGVRSRAVRRGLARRGELLPTRLGVDETSYQKRHEYVTVVSDLDRGTVIEVADDRQTASLDKILDALPQKARDGITAVAMDMWMGFITSVRKHIPDADQKICFDRFHVMQHLNRAVNDVRKQEHRAFRAAGEDTLTGKKYLFLRAPENLDRRLKRELDHLLSSSLKTGRAWAIKEAARELWHYVHRTWAQKAWKRWTGWADRSRLDPMKRAAVFVKNHLWGIINAVVLQVTNARAESLNAGIQRLKRMACGFRNRGRFREAILFHLGGLDLYPATLATHSKA